MDITYREMAVDTVCKGMKLYVPKCLEGGAA